MWLITGGCGFLGSNLAAKLLAQGEAVVVLDNLSRTGSARNLAWLRARAERAGTLHVVVADVRAAADIDALVQSHASQLTTVAHLAGQVAMTTSLARPRQDFEVNALGTLNVLEAVRAHVPTATVMFSSTNKVYGDLTQHVSQETETRWTLPELPMGVAESTPLAFHSPYGCSKGAADQYVLDYHRMFGLRTVVFRHGSMFGGRQFATVDQGWVGWFCQETLRQRAEGPAAAPFTVSGDGKQVRDLLAVEDAVACYLKAARAPAVAGRAFNIGGGPANSLSLLELFTLLHAELQVRPKVVHQSARPHDQRVFVADIRAAHAAFGWRPEVSVVTGVRRMLGWLQDPG